MGSVYFEKKSNKWVAQVKVKGLSSFSMVFDTKEEADDCVKEVESKIKTRRINLRKNEKILKILGETNESN